MGAMVNIPSILKPIVAVFFLATLPVQAQALTPAQVFDKVKDSIVVVKTLDAQGKVKGQGSGVLLPSGQIATNCHVVEGGAYYQVCRGKEGVRATLYAEDRDKDICLLDAKGLTGKSAQLGKAAGLKVGVPVYAVGAPQGLELSLSDGIVAQLRGGPPPLIQTTAAISPGSSGGGLFDGEGRLVGLTTLYIEGGQNLNFAMPVEWISKVKSGRKQAGVRRSQTNWVKRSVALEQMKDWQEMLDWSLKWTKSESKNEQAWHSLGFAYGNLKRINEAIDAFRQAIRINPNNAKTWQILGFAYSELKRDSDAIEAYRQAISINSEYAEAWNSLGITYSNLKYHNEAVEAFRQAIRISPEHAETWNNLGIAYGKLNRYNDAVDPYRQALRINPKDADTWNSLGFAYRKLKRYKDAIDAYRQSLQINSRDAETWFDLGFVYSELKRDSDTIEAYRQAISINPKFADA
jgi:tetratricopeptide (TPR) repeat protein